MMPRLDGLALIQALRADSATRTIPLILLSARAGEESRIEGLEAGADDYLVKPFSARELEARVRSVLAVARIRRETAEELVRTNELLREFSHVVAHDLQAPLRNIGLFTQLLNAKYAPYLAGEALEISGHVLEGVARMQDLIRSLLAYAEAGKTHATDLVDTSEIFRRVCENLRPHITEADATILGGQLPEVRGDRTRLTQLFQNLIGNSLKYRDKKPVRIEVDSARRAADWLFSIKDTGEGIEARYFENIFRPLKRLHGNEIPGTGIGLALCARIVQEVGGRIWVESEPGAGSTFYFTWPTEQANKELREI
jgi:two-component system, sensor histidine kinase and response regulator